jgi:hypothetical protein
MIVLKSKIVTLSVITFHETLFLSAFSTFVLYLGLLLLIKYKQTSMKTIDYNQKNTENSNTRGRV